MPYPTIPAPYGLVPAQLIGSQSFAEASRMYPILSGAAAMYNGDLVALTTGGVVVPVTAASMPVPTTVTNAQGPVVGMIGVMLGSEYTQAGGPLFGKMRNNFWPNGLVASDGVAYVSDDPDTIFKSVVVAQPTTGNSSATAVVGYMSPAFVGTNCYYVAGNGGNAANGASFSGVSGNTPSTTNGNTVAGNLPKAGAATAAFRVVQLVQETAVTISTTVTANATSATQTVASTAGIQPGMQVIVSTATGAAAGSPSANTYVVAVASATSVVLNASVAGVANTQISFIGYPEVLVKLNFGQHTYYNATSF